jgi:hypothetical protein
LKGKAAVAKGKTAAKAKAPAAKKGVKQASKSKASADTAGDLDSDENEAPPPVDLATSVQMVVPYLLNIKLLNTGDELLVFKAASSAAPKRALDVQPIRLGDLVKKQRESGVLPKRMTWLALGHTHSTDTNTNSHTLAHTENIWHTDIHRLTLSDTDTDTAQALSQTHSHSLTHSLTHTHIHTHIHSYTHTHTHGMRGAVLTQTRTQPQAQTQSATAPQTHKQFIVCMPVCVPSCLGPRAVAAELANLAPSCLGPRAL